MTDISLEIEPISQEVDSRVKRKTRGYREPIVEIQAHPSNAGLNRRRERQARVLDRERYYGRRRHDRRRRVRSPFSILAVAFILVSFFYTGQLLRTELAVDPDQPPPSVVSQSGALAKSTPRAKSPRGKPEFESVKPSGVPAR